MSYFDDASLVMIPSGYKTSKVYSVKPTDGSGDLTFSRSNDTATRVASNGLIERVRTNILLESNGFSTVSWVKSGTGTGLAPVVTANAGTAPDGTNTASRIQFNCVGSTSADRSILNQSRTSANLTPHASSVFIKAFSAGEVGKQVRFVTELSGAQLIITLTSDWQRVINVGTSSSTSINFLLETRGTVTTNTTADVLLAFAQIETGDIATDYIATTTAAVSVGPVANVPRLDYLNSSCPRLLLEPQRTNLVLYSEQFDNAYWLNSGLSLSANLATSPDGYVNADIAAETAATTQHGLSSGVISFTSGTTYTFSAFAKNAPSGRGFVQLYGFALGSGAANVFANFDLNTGVVGTATGGTSTITNYGNGWYRCTFTFACGNSLSERINLVNVTSASATAGLSYTGDITKAIYWYGAQVEAGAYATSYIPTLGAAVTRGADAASKTGISSLIGQTEGTLFVEFNSAILENYTQRIFTVSDDTNNNVIGLQLAAANQITFYVENGGVNQVVITKGTPAITLGQNVKVAAAYKANDFVLYVNGVQVGTDTSGSVPATTMLRYANPTGNAPYIGKVVQTLLFKTRLSNADLAALTA